MSTKTGLVFEFIYYSSSDYEEPELILKKCSFELDIGYMASLKPYILTGIFDSHFDLENEVSYLVEVTQFSEGDNCNPNIFYQVSCCHKLIQQTKKDD